MKNVHYFLPLLACLTACQPTDKASNHPQAPNSQASSVSGSLGSIATSTTENVSGNVSSTLSTTAPTLTADGKIQINWQQMDSGVPAVDKRNFSYKFAPDSIPVQNYVKAYKVDNLTAQYNLTIGMGANEPLDKVLDQIGTSYVSHELTAGKDSKLIIHTTPKVMASEHNYILTDPFAKGLILPVKIIPDGKKS